MQTSEETPDDDISPEDAADIELTEKVLADPSRWIPLEEFKRQLGLTTTKSQIRLIKIFGLFL